MSDSLPPSQEEISEAILGFIKSNGVDEKEKFVKENRSVLLNDAAIEYISATIERNTEELAIRMLEYHRDLLQKIVDLGGSDHAIWMAFTMRRKMQQINSQQFKEISELIRQLVNLSSHDETLKIVKENFHLLRDQGALIACDVLIRNFSQQGFQQTADRIKEIRGLILEIQQNRL